MTKQKINNLVMITSFLLVASAVLVDGGFLKQHDTPSACRNYAKSETPNCAGCTSITSGEHKGQEFDGCKWNPDAVTVEKRCTMVHPGSEPTHGTYYPGFSPFNSVAKVCPYPDEDLSDQEQDESRTDQEEKDSKAREVLHMDAGESWDHHCKDTTSCVSPFLHDGGDKPKPLCHFSELGITVDHVDSSMRVFVRLPIGLRLINCYTPGKETKKQFEGTLAIEYNQGRSKVALKGQGYNQGRPAKVRDDAYGAVWFTPSAANYRHNFCEFDGSQFQEYIIKVPIVVEFNSWKRDQKTHLMGGTNVGDANRGPNSYTDKQWEKLNTAQRRDIFKSKVTTNVDVGYTKWSGSDFTGTLRNTAAGGIRRKGGSGYLACRECEIVLATKFMNKDYLDISIRDKNFGEWKEQQEKYIEP